MGSPTGVLILKASSTTSHSLNTVLYQGSFQEGCCTPWDEALACRDAVNMCCMGLLPVVPSCTQVCAALSRGSEADDGRGVPHNCRVDDFVIFDSLSRRQIAVIVRLQAQRVEDRLRFRKIKLQLTDSAVEYLADKVLCAPIDYLIVCKQEQANFNRFCSCWVESCPIRSSYVSHLSTGQLGLDHIGSLSSQCLVVA